MRNGLLELAFMVFFYDEIGIGLSHDEAKVEALLLRTAFSNALSLRNGFQVALQNHNVA